MALIVALLTAALLTNTGITLTHQVRLLTCPYFENHTPVAHVHNDDCYDANGRLICELPELSLHTHDANCYTENKKLVCGLTEEDDGAHIHTDDCYQVTSYLSCELEEITETHVHSAACFTVVEQSAEEISQTTSKNEANGGLTNPAQTHDENDVDLDLANYDQNYESNDADSIDSKFDKLETNKNGSQDETANSIYGNDYAADSGNKIVSQKDEGSSDTNNKSSVQNDNNTNIDNKSPVENDDYSNTSNLSSDQKDENSDPEKNSSNNNTGNDGIDSDVSVRDDETAPESTLEPGDSKADVESDADWNRMFHYLQLNGNWGEDLVAVAKSQIDYAESTKNYIWEKTDAERYKALDDVEKHASFIAHDDADDEDYVRKGYTRYGGWYKDPYADWDALFVAFCMNYAEIPSNKMPFQTDLTKWIQDLEKREIYMSAAAAADTENETDIRVPREGDLVFFQNAKEDIVRVGIISYIDHDTNELRTIEGDRDDAVHTEEYALNDWHIAGFGLLPENPDLADDKNDPANPDSEEGNANNDSDDSADSYASDTESSNIDTANSDDETSPVMQEADNSERKIYILFDEETESEDTSESEDKTTSDDTQEDLNPNVFYMSEYDPQVEEESKDEDVYPHAFDMPEKDQSVEELSEDVEVDVYPHVFDMPELDTTIEEDADNTDELASDDADEFISNDVENEIEIEDEFISNDTENEIEISEDSENEITEETLQDDENSDDAPEDLNADAPEAEPSVSISLQKTLTASDGATYLVTVTYSPEACIPDGAELEVSEILEGTDAFDRYKEKTAEMLLEARQLISFARFFDITIVKDDAAVIVAAPVDVQIQLLDVASVEMNQQQVVHFDESPLNVHPYEVSYESVEAAPFDQMPEVSEEATPSEEAPETPIDISAVRPQSKPSKAPKISQPLTSVEQPISASIQEVPSQLEPSQEEPVPAEASPVDQSLAADAQAPASPSEGQLLTPTYHPLAPSQEAPAFTAPELIQSTEENGTIRFTAEGFSVYGIIGTTIEKIVLASDGHNYRIKVSYFADSGIPEDAELEVSEILPGENGDANASSVNGMSYEDYVAYTEHALGWEAGSASYARVFDISIIKDGEKVQPKEGSSVTVRIELADVNDAGKLNVVHFADEANEGDVVVSETEDQAVSFEADGFSAYAIVQGPDSIPIGWHKISSIEDLISKGSEGIYIGHPDGYYYGNTLVNDGSRVGITKTKPAQSYPAAAAAKYYFEQVEGSDNQVYVYCLEPDGSTKQYVYNGGNNSLSFTDENNKTAFTVTLNSNGTFKLNNGAWYWNMQGGANGTRFCSYNSANDGNNNVNLWYYVTTDSDPYDLDGRSYGLMNWNGGVAGKALMASSSSENQNQLDAKSLIVMSTANNSSQLFVPNDSDVSMWKFNWIHNDQYRLSTVVDGSTKYLKIEANGLRLVSDENEASEIQVIPGTGTHAGEICLKSDNKTLTFSGTVEGGFSVGGSAGSEWLNLVALSELTKDYFLTYSARKVSVSDESITNGSRVIVYTRSWNEEKLKYEYYAIASDGTLVPVYESGDSIEWVSGQINTLLWNFVEYYWEGTNDPNYYYELFNQYSEKYIAPQVTGDQILSDETIGINLNGRRDGQYYSTVLAWDEDNYSYVGLKVEDGRIVTCPKSKAMDFYFAVMQDMNVDDTLTTVPTLDHTQFGITMKIVDFGGKTAVHDGGSTSTEEQYNVIGDGSYTQNSQKSGLLSTYLGANDYPIAIKTGKSLQELFAGAQEVNHLFIESTYYETGYYEYDSTQNFATLTDSGNFRVYKELGTMDNSNKNTLKHGQFMPFNDLEAGVFASVNGKNLYDAEARQLSDSDPRKYEQMYLVKNPDYYYGVELEASFTQTPNGLDAWGHDIIYEFTGDDDFWLYVDGELVIDLGGIHGALPGSVNFRTGEVYVNGSKTTLKDLFYNNYLNRDHTPAEAQAYVDGIFEEKSPGQWVFKDDTTHTMRIFYMERGAGAANLHMRFNLAAAKKGTVQLTKELAGVDEDNVLAEFPYQIWYKKDDGNEYRLTNAIADSSNNDNYVLYKDTVNPVKYQQSVAIGGNDYKDVFFLKPGETADISFPEGMTEYRIVECGVNTDVYSTVTANNQVLEGETVAGSSNRKDYGIEYDTTDRRPKVNYVNTVNKDALRTLRIEKKLYEADGITPIGYSTDQTEFAFRMYLASEFSELDVANMQTYHVKDPDGYYCQWDATNKRFVKIGDGITDFSKLDATLKAAASFTTSVYGTIGRIPTDFTVEFRDVLAGTKYRVEERKDEIPDGYSFQKYDGFDTDNARVVERGNTGIEGVTGTVVSDRDALVVVNNMKGWGLRVNKVWRDKDYMSSRDDTYFAIFTEDSNHSLTIVPDSVRKLPYDSNPQTIYWYYDRLPVEGTTGLNDYLIREVQLVANEEQTIAIDANGVVTGFSSATPINHNGQIVLNGTQKGETTSSQFTYQVQYAQGEISSYSNVRVDTVTNDRPGIILKKQDWSGKPLKGATFTLETDGTTLGTFTSGEDGLITTAFLSNNKYYRLTETSPPQGYHGLETVMTIHVNNNGEVSVSGPDAAYYSLSEAQGTTLATVIIKNRPFTFQAIKTDGDLDELLAGVEFALHRQVTVNGVTTIDLNPMPGYESLKTDTSGVIPKIDNTLPAGTYELRERETIAGYELLSGYIQFTVSPTGTITLGTHPVGVELSGKTDNDGTLKYELSIPNYRRKDFTFHKVWRVATGEESISWPNGKSITVNILQAKGESDDNPSIYATYTINQTDVGTLNKEIVAVGDQAQTLPKLKVIGNSDNTYTFKLEDLPAKGKQDESDSDYIYYVTETNPVPEYQNAKYFNGTQQIMGASRIGSGGTIWNDQNGYELPSTGGPGNSLMYLIGALLTAFAGVGLVMRKRRRR